MRYNFTNIHKQLVQLHNTINIIIFLILPWRHLSNLFVRACHSKNKLTMLFTYLARKKKQIQAERFLMKVVK